jgi:hypothetical protein
MADIITKTIGVGGDYANLEAWEAGEAADLVAADEIARVAFLDEDHSSNLTLNNAAWNTDATRFIWIDSHESARHLGVPGRGARFDIASGTAINIAKAEHVHLTNLEFTATTPAASMKALAATVAGATITCDKLLIHGLDQSNSRAIHVLDVGCTINVFNCAIYNVERQGIGLDAKDGAVVAKIYNNTIYNCGDSGATDGNMVVELLSAGSYDIDERNNVLGAGGDADLVNGNGTPASDWNAACDQNMASDASLTAESLPGTKLENVTFQAGTAGSGTRAMFTNLTAGSENLKPVRPTTRSDNALFEFGNNLTSETVPANIDLEIDIEGRTRPATDLWTAGAYNYPLPTAAKRTTGRGAGPVKVVQSNQVDPTDVIEMSGMPQGRTCYLSAQFFDADGNVITPAGGTVTVLIETVGNLGNFEAESGNTITASAPNTITWTANTHAIRASADGLVGVDTWRVVATFNN